MKPLEQWLAQAPRVPLGTWPTPIHRLARIERQLGCEGVYIKRDDMTGLGLGGNKVRSLEFILADALAQRADTIFAAGPQQSNLCMLVASACAKLGLRCVLVCNGDPPPTETGNLLLNRLLGAEVHFIGHTGEPECIVRDVRAARVNELELECSASGGHPYAVKNGATTGHGALGYANAVLELCAQCGAENIALRHIFAPGGNGGVAAGLVYGNALLGFPFEVHIISVEDDAATLTANIANTIAQTVEITGLAFEYEVPRACRVIDAYRGGGWGCNTQESEAMVLQFARMEGVFVENIYTSKVLVGMLDLLRSGAVSGPSCFIHTGGTGSLFSQYEHKAPEA